MLLCQLRFNVAEHCYSNQGVFHMKHQFSKQIKQHQKTLKQATIIYKQ